MNKFDRQIAKRNKKEKNKFRNWWRHNCYIVSCIVLFPIWAVDWTIGKLKNRYYVNCVFTPQKAKEFWDKYFYKKCEIDSDGFWYCDYWRLNDKIKPPYRTFVRKYENQIVAYLFDSYEIEGYKKSIEDNGYEKWVGFKKKED